MPPTLDGKLVVAISSRALFDLESENAVFETGDDGAYRALQLERLDDPPPTGVAYPLVQKLLRLNSAAAQPVEVVIASRNDPVSGLRIFRAAKHYGLSIERGIFTRGRSPHRYLAPLNASLFLSANPQDVRAALLAGYPAAQVYPASAADAARNSDEIRIAFDGDAVLFSDQAERVFKRESLERFVEHEVIRINEPLPAGPFKPFLAALHGLQSRARENTVQIRTALVTARSAPAPRRMSARSAPCCTGASRSMRPAFSAVFQKDRFSRHSNRTSSSTTRRGIARARSTRDRQGKCCTASPTR